MTRDDALESIKNTEAVVAAAAMVSALKMFTMTLMGMRDGSPPDSTLHKQADDAERALAVYMHNNIDPIFDEVKRNPNVKLRDSL